MNFKDNLKILNDEYMITPEALARKAGLKQGSGWRYASGKQMPRLDRALAMVRAVPEVFEYKWRINGCIISVEKDPYSDIPEE